MRTMACGALALHTGGLFLFLSPRRLHGSGVWLQAGLVSRCVAEKSDRRHPGTVAVRTDCQNWCWKCSQHRMPHPCLLSAAGTAFALLVVLMAEVSLQFGGVRTVPLFALRVMVISSQQVLLLELLASVTWNFPEIAAVSWSDF